MSRKFKLEFNNELSKSFAHLLANVNTPEKADLVIVPNLPRSLSVTENAVNGKEA